MFIEQTGCILILGSMFIFVSISGILFFNKIHKTGIKGEGEITGFEIDDEGYKTPIIKFTIFSDTYLCI